MKPGFLRLPLLILTLTASLSASAQEGSFEIIHQARDEVRNAEKVELDGDSTGYRIALASGALVNGLAVALTGITATSLYANPRFTRKLRMGTTQSKMIVASPFAVVLTLAGLEAALISKLLSSSENHIDVTETEKAQIEEILK